MGESKHDGLAIPGQVVLAHEPPFELGPLKIDPPTRQVASRIRSETLEPRVMQVLVVLARADGGIVTRDELIERCWDGRIVGEDAIHRVLSRLRHIAAGIGGGGFAIETITRVGYRLRVLGGAPASAPRVAGPEPAWRRRSVLAGGAAATALAAGIGFLAVNQRGHEPSREAIDRYEKGIHARDLNLPGTGAQAKAFFAQAIEADPGFAAAWGALALQLVLGMPFERQNTLQATADRARAAARSALELDPSDPDAQAALALIPSSFRNWGRVEKAIRNALAAHPDHGILTSNLAVLLADTGQWDRAVEYARKAAGLRPLVPMPTATLIYNLWSDGRLIEAEAESRRSLDRWPRSYLIWFARVEFLVYSGRPEAALEFARDSDHLPGGLDPFKEVPIVEARALAGGDRKDIAKARDMLLEAVAADINVTPQASRFCATIGAVHEALELLEAYLLRRGRFAANAPKPIHPLARVSTHCLFDPPARALWPDPRFAALTREVGLDAYWRSIGFRPPHIRS